MLHFPALRAALSAAALCAATGATFGQGVAYVSARRTTR